MSDNTDFAEVTVLVHRENNNIVIVDFDIGDGSTCRLVTSPANLKAMGLRMYASARSILGELSHTDKRPN